ncbi:MAG: hypothetical protein HFJ80_05905 [Clostridiales bacterium]|nr:hypothetical protein [Clostridiales bacterium]
MVFLTNALLDDIAELTEPSDALHKPVLQAFAERSDFTAETKFLLEKCSFRTKLVYVEIDYFGYAGTQAGVSYENGRISIEPQEGNGSINLLLKRLGVWCAPSQNEFDSLRVGIYRRMDKWCDGRQS